jgi:hypothetical protein
MSQVRELIGKSTVRFLVLAAGSTKHSFAAYDFLRALLPSADLRTTTNRDHQLTALANLVVSPEDPAAKKNKRKPPKPLIMRTKDSNKEFLLAAFAVLTACVDAESDYEETLTALKENDRFRLQKPFDGGGVPPPSCSRLPCLARQQHRSSQGVVGCEHARLQGIRQCCCRWSQHAGGAAGRHSHYGIDGCCVETTGLGDSITLSILMKKAI